MTGFTIGGHESPPERGPYVSAIADLVRDGVRWPDVSEEHRERLACLYAAEHCEDSLIGHMLEESFWAALARAVPDVRAYVRGGDVKRATLNLAAIASVQFEKFTWAAMAACEATVRLHYLDAWDAAHGDPPDDPSAAELDAAERSREAVRELER